MKAMRKVEELFAASLGAKLVCDLAVEDAIFAFDAWTAQHVAQFLEQGSEVTTVRWSSTQRCISRAGWPEGLSSADTQMLVSNNATGRTSLGSHFASGRGDLGFDGGGPVAAGPFAEARQQHVELLAPLRFGVHGDQTDLPPLQAKALQGFQDPAFKACTNQLFHRRPPGPAGAVRRYRGPASATMQAVPCVVTVTDPLTHTTTFAVTKKGVGSLYF